VKDEKLVVKPKKAKGENGYKTFSIRVKEEIIAQIDEVSAQTGRSRNELIGMFLEYAVERCVIEEQ
jgi:metal-responsive CopG/Arc/MetJ family transcriptional regulator